MTVADRGLDRHHVTPFAIRPGSNTSTLTYGHQFDRGQLPHLGPGSVDYPSRAKRDAGAQKGLPAVNPGNEADVLAVRLGGRAQPKPGRLIADL